MATTSTGADAEHRITVLLKMLGPKLSRTLLEDLPTPKQLRLQQRIDSLEAAPPSDREVVQVLSEFDRFLRFAERRQSAELADSEQAQLASQMESPFGAINHVSNERLVAALRDESPRTVALVLNTMEDAKAASVLGELPTEKRDNVVMELKGKLAPPQILLVRLINATIARCESFVEEELAAERVSSDARVARLLKTMEPERRGEVLAMLEGADPEACERIRGTLFTFDDLLFVQDKTLQRVLGEIDARSLAQALSGGDEKIKERVLDNMSKRARMAIAEELEFMGDLSPAELEAAFAEIVKVMVELDKTGDLLMK